MGAMLVGLITGIPLMIITYSFVALCIVLIAAIAFLTYKLKMSVIWWTIAACIMNIGVLIPFIYALKRISKAKICPACGAKSRNRIGFCTACSETTKVFDEKKFIIRILIVIGILIGISIVIKYICFFIFPQLYHQ